MLSGAICRDYRQYSSREYYSISLVSSHEYLHIDIERPRQVNLLVSRAFRNSIPATLKTFSYSPGLFHKASERLPIPCQSNLTRLRSLLRLRETVDYHDTFAFLREFHQNARRKQKSPFTF
jgi:hypothetical protein